MLRTDVSRPVLAEQAPDRALRRPDDRARRPSMPAAMTEGKRNPPECPLVRWPSSSRNGPLAGRHANDPRASAQVVQAPAIVTEKRGQEAEAGGDGQGGPDQ